MDNGIISDLREKRKEGKVVVGIPENIKPPQKSKKRKVKQEPSSNPNVNPPQMRNQDNAMEYKDGGMVQRFITRFRRDYNTTKGHQIGLEEKEPNDGLNVEEPASKKTKQENKTPKKDFIEEKRKEEKKLDSLINQTDRVLIKVQTVFPFTFFPNTLYVDENKISYIEKTFFFTEYVRNVLLANVAEVKVGTSPFFASLTLIDMSFDKRQEIRIPYLRKQDAVDVQHIIQGIILARKEGIDLSKFSDDELREKIKELGNIRGEALV